MEGEAMRGAAFNADMRQMQLDMDYLHKLAAKARTPEEQQQVERLAHIVDWRLNVLASYLASLDTPTRPMRKQ
jgi:hypothetical protein